MLAAGSEKLSIGLGCRPSGPAVWVQRERHPIVQPQPDIVPRMPHDDTLTHGQGQLAAGLPVILRPSRPALLGGREKEGIPQILISLALCTQSSQEIRLRCDQVAQIFGNRREGCRG